MNASIDGPIERFEWWQACVEGLPDLGRVHPVVVNDRGIFLAVAPLVVRPGLVPRFELIGVRQLHEPMGFVYSSSTTLAALCQKLAQQKVPIDLQRVPRHSPLVDQLQHAFKGRGLLRVSATTPYPFLALDASWATPEKHFNAGRRSDFRRSRRHADKAGTVQFELVTPDDTNIDRLLSEAYDAELRGWKGSQGSALALDPVRGGFYRRYFHECMRQRILRLAFMRIDGVAVAMQIGVHINNRLWLLKIGYNEAYSRISPGTLLMLEVVRQAALDGTRSIEFLGTAEPWTELWTQDKRECVRIKAYPPSALSAAALITDAAAWVARRLSNKSQLAVARLRSVAKMPVTALTRYLSRAYIAGPGLADALRTYDRLAEQGKVATIGYFNPTRQPASEIAEVARAVVAALAAGRQDGYVSLKVPPMGYDIGLVEDIARRAAAADVGVHFDSHAIDTTDPTFACVEAALRQTPQVSCTLPARWPRSLDDAERAIALKLRVRVVKGQWADPAHPDIDINAAYLRLVDRLAGRARAVAVATHDPALAQEALRRLRAAGTPCELEQLYGLPTRAVSAQARQMGVPVRVYIPFGAAWLPYTLRQLARKPTTLWWLSRDALAAFARQSTANSAHATGQPRKTRKPPRRSFAVPGEPQ
ncbi:MAG TPA: proline dehydrogenase family protein [Azonexus sp.]|nr:proline dehydrogenase family protein [Azonexus sp.]